MVAMRFLLCFSLVVGSAWAAQDYNSSRSNKSSIIAADLGDQSNDFSKEISFAGFKEYTAGSKAIMREVSIMEARVSSIRTRMTIGIFVNYLFAEMQEMKCRSFEDKECVDRAVQKAEAITVQKTKHDTVKNSINNVR